MNAGWLAVLLALLAVTPLAAQETVVTGISKDNIALTADFNGSEIFIFGAIRREGPAQPDAAPLDIIITIKGPTRGVTVRRKDRRFGVWVNTDAVRVREAPTFYSIATTSPLDSLLTETELLRYQIGMNQAVRRVGGHPTITDTSSFGEAVVRIASDGGSQVKVIVSSAWKATKSNRWNVTPPTSVSTSPSGQKRWSRQWLVLYSSRKVQQASS